MTDCCEVAKEAKEDLAVWVAAFFCTACDRHVTDTETEQKRFDRTVYQLTVSRLHDAVKQLATSSNPPAPIQRMDPDAKLHWLNEAISDAHILGLRNEGPESEFITMDLGTAKQTIKWVIQRKGRDYIHEVERQAIAVAPLLAPS